MAFFQEHNHSDERWARVLMWLDDHLCIEIPFTLPKDNLTVRTFSVVKVFLQQDIQGVPLWPGTLGKACFVATQDDVRQPFDEVLVRYVLNSRRHRKFLRDCGEFPACP